MLTNKIFNASALTRTTIQVVVVRFKGVATRLSRRADCSQQTCQLGSAGLLSLVTTVKKIPSRPPKDTFLNPERDILKPRKIYS